MWERVVQQGGIETIVWYPPFDGTEAAARAWLDWKIGRHSANKGWAGAQVGDQISLSKDYGSGRVKERVILIRLVA